MCAHTLCRSLVSTRDTRIPTSVISVNVQTAGRETTVAWWNLALTVCDVLQWYQRFILFHGKLFFFHVKNHLNLCDNIINCHNRKLSICAITDRLCIILQLIVGERSQLEIILSILRHLDTRMVTMTTSRPVTGT